MSDLTTWMDGHVAALAALPVSAILLATFGFLVLETSVLIGLLVPGDLVVLVAAGLMPSWGARVLLVIAALAGALTGQLIGYGLGRAAGPALRRSWAGRRMGPQRWQRAEAFLAGRGARALVPVRFVAVVQAVTPVVAGTVRMPLRRFAQWSAIGSLIWAITFVAIGTAAGASLAHVNWTLRLGVVAGLALLIGSLLGARAMRRQARLDRDAESSPAPPPPPRSGSDQVAPMTSVIARPTVVHPTVVHPTAARPTAGLARLD